MSNSDEPNFVIYYLIKEMDFLVENNNYLSFNAESSSIRQLQHAVNDAESISKIDSSHHSNQTIGFGSQLPSPLLNDYKEMLAIAIEIF